MNEKLIEKVAGYIKHREPHFSREDAKAAAFHAVSIVLEHASNSYVGPLDRRIAQLEVEIIKLGGAVPPEQES